MDAGIISIIALTVLLAIREIREFFWSKKAFDSIKEQIETQNTRTNFLENQMSALREIKDERIAFLEQQLTSERQMSHPALREYVESTTKLYSMSLEAKKNEIQDL